ncbi:MAG TPA: coenzyme F420-0:L-glutamate ligase, partial [Bacillota bacterium]
MKGLQLWPIEGLGEVRPGDDLGAMLAEGIRRLGVTLEDRDIVVVTQKVVSKSEGRIVDLAQVQPSPFARALADRFGKDARLVELVLGETARVVRMDRSVWIMETRHGFVCANAGVDLSNVEGERAALLPLDPDASASRLRARLGELCGAEPAVIISDTFGRPWRMGQTNVAIGVAGMRPLLDYRGTRDDFGAELKVTHIA